MKRWLEGSGVYVYSASALLALGVYALSGTHTRLWADDYCYSGSLRAEGFWVSQLNAYFLTSDRYSVMPLSSLSEFFGVNAIRFWPALAVLLWLGALAWLMVVLLARAGRPGKPEAVLLAAHLLLFSLLMAPNLFQVFYWRTGMLTYLMPLVVQTCLAALLLGAGQGRSLLPERDSPGNAWRAWPRLGGLLGLAFWGGGFSETTAALQAAALILALGGVLLLDRDPARKHNLRELGAALLGALLALLVLFLSPAAHLRQGYFAAPPGLLALLGMSFQFAFDFISLGLRGLPLPSLVALVVPLLLGLLAPAPGGAQAQRVRLLALPVVWVVVTLLVAACFAPSVYAESAYAEERAQLPAVFVLVGGLSASGWLMGRLASASISRPSWRAAAALLLLLLSLYPLRVASQTYAKIAPLRQRAALWDARDRQIRAQLAAGAEDLLVPALDSIAGLSEIGPNPNYFVNRCSANYYGLKTIRTQE